MATKKKARVETIRFNERREQVDAQLDDKTMGTKARELAEAQIELQGAKDKHKREMAQRRDEIKRLEGKVEALAKAATSGVEKVYVKVFDQPVVASKEVITIREDTGAEIARRPMEEQEVMTFCQADFEDD